MPSPLLLCTCLSFSGTVVQLKAKEAKNVGEILEMLPVFRRLLESFQTGGSGTVTEQTCAEAKERDEAPSKLSRLELGLAIRQVCSAEHQA